MASPIEQFAIKPIVDIKIEGVDISFSNSALFMVVALILGTALMVLATRGRALVPGRMQSLAEMCYELVANMIRTNVGAAGRPYFPFLFTLFLFVMIGNLLGMVPGAFTYTSHLAVTFGLALVVFIGCTIIGFARHGARYLGIFFPQGAPLWTAVILVPIEMISYLSRPISLSVRLFSNMTVGHVLLKTIAGFVVALGGLSAWYGIPGAIVSQIFVILLIILELLVATIQGYVFVILSCIYLHDALAGPH